MVPRLKQCINRLNLPDGEWLTVAQWPYYSGNEPSETFPTIRSALDKVSQTHPIVLLADDGHHGAVNSVAMSLATDKNGLNIGLSKTTLNNEFAHLQALIGVDNTGEPNGVINEDARKIVNLPNLWGILKLISMFIPRSHSDWQRRVLPLRWMRLYGQMKLLILLNGQSSHH